MKIETEEDFLRYLNAPSNPSPSDSQKDQQEVQPKSKSSIFKAIYRYETQPEYVEKFKKTFNTGFKFVVQHVNYSEEK